MRYENGKIGIIRISEELVFDPDCDLSPLMSLIRVLRAEHHPIYGYFEYHCYSSEFESINEYESVPFYEVIITDSKDVEFRRNSHA